LDLDRYYYGARYYDPELGRFTSPDPISDDWTPYSYVRNNPIMNNDPTGMMTGGGSGFTQGEYLGGFNNGTMMDDPMSWENMCSSTRADCEEWAGRWMMRQREKSEGGGKSQKGTITITGGNSSKEKKDESTDDVGVNVLFALIDYLFLGTDISTNLNTIDLSNVSAGDFPGGVGSEKYINLDGRNFSNANDALVYGQFKLTLEDGGESVHASKGFDYFDLDYHKGYSPGVLARNYVVFWGREVLGEGNNFYIHLNGSAPIGGR
jgi:hypothetical protein